MPVTTVVRVRATKVERRSKGVKKILKLDVAIAGKQACRTQASRSGVPQLRPVVLKWLKINIGHIYDTLIAVETKSKHFYSAVAY